MNNRNNTGYFADRVRMMYLITLMEGALVILLLMIGRARTVSITLIVTFGVVNSICLYFWIIRPYRITKAVLRKAALEKEILDEAVWKLPGFCREERDYLWYVSSTYSRKELLELEIRESELLALQTQINPHFLYNTLDAIRSDALSEGNEIIAEIAESLASYFRYSISSLNLTVSLDEELHNIQEYFKIQRYRFGRRLKFRIEWAEDMIEKEKLYIPKMILQPLVENAIFHGIEPKETPGTVTILIDRTEKNLYLCVADDGVGMSDKQTDELNQSISQFYGNDAEGLRKTGHGIALRNVNHRIRLIYGEEYGIYITSAEQIGTKIWMTLPVRMSEEKL